MNRVPDSDEIIHKINHNTAIMEYVKWYEKKIT